MLDYDERIGRLSVGVRDPGDMGTLERLLAKRLYGVHERVGTCDERVEAEGFAPWTREGAEVEEGRCHVETVEVSARPDPK